MSCLGWETSSELLISARRHTKHWGVVGKRAGHCPGAHIPFREKHKKSAPTWCFQIVLSPVMGTEDDLIKSNLGK
jgi:hypothetical protein